MLGVVEWAGPSCAAAHRGRRCGWPSQLSDGFKTCTALFCAAPLAVLGAVQDGLLGYWFPLAVKAVMDGLATLGFAGLFRWAPTLAALPVLAFQGTITLACAQWLKPLLAAHGLIDSVNAVGGLCASSSIRVSSACITVPDALVGARLPGVPYHAEEHDEEEHDARSSLSGYADEQVIHRREQARSGPCGPGLYRP